MSSASLGVTPKREASNDSASARTPQALTYLGSRSMAGATPAAGSSASQDTATDSSPAGMLCQNSSTFLAPGNLPAIPIMATSKRWWSSKRAEPVIGFLTRLLSWAAYVPGVASVGGGRSVASQPHRHAAPGV